MTRLAEIGPKLAVIRRAQGLTQRKLAERLGLSQPQIARWEASGYLCASLENAGAVADALGLQVGIASLAGSAEMAHEAAAVWGTTATTQRARAATDLGEVIARLRAERRTLQRDFGFVRLGVFGSFAVGEQSPRSDVDLLVEIESPTLHRVAGGADLCEAALGRHVDLMRPELLRPELRERVLGEVVFAW